MVHNSVHNSWTNWKTVKSLQSFTNFVIWRQLQLYIESLHLIQLDRFKRNCKMTMDCHTISFKLQWRGRFLGVGEQLLGHLGFQAGGKDGLADKQMFSPRLKTDHLMIGRLKFVGLFFLDLIKFQLVYTVKVKVWRVKGRKQMFLQTYYQKFARASHALIMTKHSSNTIRPGHL